jgi:hypothetical protein
VLEHTHGLKLSSRLTRDLWPAVEQVRVCPALCTASRTLWTGMALTGRAPGEPFQAAERGQMRAWSIPQVLQRRFRRIGEDVRRKVPAEVDKVVAEVRFVAGPGCFSCPKEVCAIAGNCTQQALLGACVRCVVHFLGTGDFLFCKAESVAFFSGHPARPGQQQVGAADGHLPLGRWTA